MTALDLLVVVLAAVAGALGHGLGLLRRLASLAGLLGGLVVGSLLLAPLLEGTGLGAQGRRTGAVVGLVALAAGGHALGMLLGERAQRRRLRSRRSRDRDRLAGAAAGILSVFAGTWLLAPVVAAVPGWPAREARGASVSHALDDLLPSPPDALQALRAVVRGTPYPSVWASGLRPAPDAGDPPAASPVPAAVVASAGASVVRVSGEACGQLQRGTAFVVAPGRLVTNAHVVAGEPTTEVTDLAGRAWPATVVAFDGDQDLALLDVPGLAAAPLALVAPVAGTEGAVLGHPGGGAQQATPFRVAQQVEATGRDLYDTHDTRRSLLVLAAELHRGDSGGPLVAPDGTVAGVALAVAPDRGDVAYALTAGVVADFIDRAGAATTPADTRGCRL